MNDKEIEILKQEREKAFNRLPKLGFEADAENNEDTLGMCFFRMSLDDNIEFWVVPPYFDKGSKFVDAHCEPTYYVTFFSKKTNDRVGFPYIFNNFEEVEKFFLEEVDQ